MRGVLLRAYLQPLKYMLQEQPKEKEAPQVLGSLPWQAQVRLQHTPCVRHEPDGLLLLQALPPPRPRRPRRAWDPGLHPPLLPQVSWGEEPALCPPPEGLPVGEAPGPAEEGGGG